jgi:hypothetical protein
MMKRMSCVRELDMLHLGYLPHETLRVVPSGYNVVLLTGHGQNGASYLGVTPTLYRKVITEHPNVLGVGQKGLWPQREMHSGLLNVFFWDRIGSEHVTNRCFQREPSERIDQGLGEQITQRRYSGKIVVPSNAASPWMSPAGEQDTASSLLRVFQ